MPNTPRRPRPADFQIAIICALKIEADAVEAVFDKDWEEDGKYGRQPGDSNEYSMGKIGKHNVVLAFMPNIGKEGASSTASYLRMSFREINLGLVVGICGAVPVTKENLEIILGDIIISKVVVQYDHGTKYSDRHVMKDTLGTNLGKPPRLIRSFLQKLEGVKGTKRLVDSTVANLNSLVQQEGFESWKYPGAHEDRLYEPTYRHKHHDSAAACSTCNRCKSKDEKVCEKALISSCAELGCNNGPLVHRARVQKLAESSAYGPLIHFGCVASGDSVMKSSHDRDHLALIPGVIAFEMESAGVWDALPTVVIKSVSDYADSHKNDRWQKFAAASAAACMKAFVNEWRVVEETPQSETGDYVPVARASEVQSESESDTSRIWKDVAYAEKLLNRKDKEKPVVENLKLAQESLSRIIVGRESVYLDSSLRQRVYWDLMVVEKELASYKGFENVVKIEHVKKALEYNIKVSEIVSSSSDTGLQVQVRVEQSIIKVRKATLEIRQGVGRNTVNEEGEDARIELTGALKELEIKYPDKYEENIEIDNYHQTKFDKLVNLSSYVLSSSPSHLYILLVYAAFTQAPKSYNLKNPLIVQLQLQLQSIYNV